MSRSYFIIVTPHMGTVDNMTMKYRVVYNSNKITYNSFIM